jgi:phosphoribosyl 1,2-cyclic phosphate phosphodiesterase
MMRITILGCGSSKGVPVLGPNWGACDPANPKNNRRRASILVQEGDASVLVDTGPDCRTQLLDAAISTLNGVIYTHAHADHLHGINELGTLNWLMKKPIDIYANPATLEEISQRFAYCLQPLPPGQGYFRPVLTPHLIDGPFNIGPFVIEPIDQDHGFSRSLGFRFNRFAYSTDVVMLDETALAQLEGLDTWVVGCLGLEPHPVHAHLDRVLEWVALLQPRRTILTHLGYTLDYETLRRQLPPGIEPGYDGLVVEV